MLRALCAVLASSPRVASRCQSHGAPAVVIMSPACCATRRNERYLQQQVRPRYYMLFTRQPMLLNVTSARSLQRRRTKKDTKTLRQQATSVTTRMSAPPPGAHSRHAAPLWHVCRGATRQMPARVHAATDCRRRRRQIRRVYAGMDGAPPRYHVILAQTQ